MKRASDIRVKSVALHWLPIETRLPIKFGAECVTRVTCARSGTTTPATRTRTLHAVAGTGLRLRITDQQFSQQSHDWRLGNSLVAPQAM